MRYKKIFVLLIFIYAYGLSAVNKDSLLVHAKRNKADTGTVNALYALAKTMLITNPDSAMLCVKASEKIARKIKFRKGQGNAFNFIGAVYYRQADYNNALHYFKQALTARIDAKDYTGVSATLGNMGAIWSDKGNDQKALKYYNLALRIDSCTGNEKGKAYQLSNIGNIYLRQSDYPSAMKHYLKALAIDEKLGNITNIVRIKTNIGTLLHHSGDLDEALKYYFSALKLAEENQLYYQASNCLGTIGIIYNEKGKKQEAIKNYLKAIELCKEYGSYKDLAVWTANIASSYIDQAETEKNKIKKKNLLDSAEMMLKETIEADIKAENVYGLAADYVHIAEILLEWGKYKEAELYLIKSLDICNELHEISIAVRAREILSQLYERQRKFEDAILNYQLSIEYRDSINSEENSKKLMQQQIQFEFGKKAAADSVKVAEEKKVMAAQFKEEKDRRYILYGGIALLLLFTVFVINRFMVTSSQKRIIADQKEFVERQKNIIEEKQKEIMDSIHYAKRIQLSHLPSEVYLVKNLKRLKASKK